MKKILAIITLLFLTVTIMTSVSATTMQSPIGKAQLTARVHADNKKNTQVQETESDNDTTTTHVKDSKMRKDLSPEERRRDDKRIVAVFVVATCMVIIPCTIKNCMIDLRNIHIDAAHLSTSKLNTLFTKLLGAILLSSFLTFTLFSLFYYIFSSYLLLGISYVILSLVLFSYSKDIRIPDIVDASLNNF